MGQGGQEMDECVQEGKFPIFGYPLVCYSPIGKPKRERGEFWGHLFRSTMKSNKQAISLIGELLDKAEEFDLKDKELYGQFARGHVQRRFLYRRNLDGSNSS